MMKRSAFVRELEADGWRVQMTRSGHYRATHPELPGKVMFMASSPSDHRSTKNARAVARRMRRKQ